MGTTNAGVLSAAEQERFAAMAERVRQLRWQADVPDGLTLAEAIALGILRPEELERAHWGGEAAPAPLATTVPGDHPTGCVG